MLLLAPDETALRRLEKCDEMMHKKGFCDLRNTKIVEYPDVIPVPERENARLEFRTPAANARHDLATLMTLTAIYNGLKEKSTIKAAVKPDLDISDMEHLKQSFKQSSHLIGDLRGCTEAGGPMRKHVDQLREAIVKAANQDKLHQPTLVELHKQDKRASLRG
jgi:hypothetical protein